MTKSSGNLSKEITPIVVGADTLLYIINYENQSGWVIASGDKRSPLILAMGENDNFDIDLSYGLHIPLRHQSLVGANEG